MRMTMRTNLLLPEELVAEVDRIAGPRGRSRYVAEALEDRLRRDRLRQAALSAAGSWRGHPDFPTSEAVIEWVRRLRREETKPGDG
jgi:predicted transcriptional regulator